jgi:phage tail-like protein
MDVNASSFQLLLGTRDWSSCTDEDGVALGTLWASPSAGAPAEWDEDRQELSLPAKVFVFPPPRGERPPRLDDRRGAGRDRYGNWYWIDGPRSTILVESVGSERTSVFWASATDDEQAAPAGDFHPVATPARPLTLAGLAVTEDHYLVAGVLEPAGLLVFDLLTGGPPTRLAWPHGVPFHPVDLAPRPGGGVVVLAIDEDHARAWELDARLRVVPARRPAAPPPDEPGSFGPRPGPVGPAAAPLAPEDATLLAGTPIAIECAPDCSILVLDRNPSGAASLLRRYRRGEEPAPGVLTEDAGLRIEVIGHDMALVAGAQAGVLGTLYVADLAGDQAFAFTVRLEEGERLALWLDRGFYPMRSFGGRGVVAGPTGAFYDFEDGWIPLARQPRSRYEQAGRVVSPVLDGHAPGCVWHRLLVDACLPPGTGLSVWSAAADDREALVVPQWEREPDPRARAGGMELPFAGDLQGTYQTVELLLQRATGRYLEVMLELHGDGRSSPRVRALRAWYPRFSYLERFLPAAYREERDSASFLDRFLANLEGFYTGIEDAVAAAQTLLDPRTTPPQTLEWLAGFVGVVLDPAWDEARRRLFLRHAPDVFRVRGTMRGIEIALRLALDPCVDDGLFTGAEGPALRGPRIVESFRTRSTPGVVFGDPTQLAPLRSVAPGQRWEPKDGRDALDARWRDYLDAAGLTPGQQEPFPTAAPAGDRAAAWRRFAADALGIVPSRAPDVDAWQAFLARRYGTVAALNALYGQTGGDALGSFADAKLPAALPPDGAPLVDWYQFHAVVLAMRRTAHRFRVLLPLRTLGDSEAAEPMRQLAERVVALQKPAHTVFDVRFFWSAFRLGEARLGEDTLLGTGSRAAELLGPAVIGTGHLGESVLGGPIASDVVRRPDLEPPASEETP